MRADAYWINGPWPGRLAIVARPRGGDWLQDDVASWAHAGLDVVVSLLAVEEANELDVTGEANYCQANDIEFVAFPIPDRGVPSSRDDTFRFVKALEANLVAGKTVGIHCRQGIGRSGMIAACLLVSSGVSPDVAFSRLSEARGFSIPETEEQRAWVDAFAPELAR